jgi:nicotinamide-nucleotide adenylyltransferase
VPEAKIFKILPVRAYWLLPKTGLFIGRFQPFHLGHLSAVKFALGKVDRLVIVVGSAQKSHEPKNPFTAGERTEMIKDALAAEKSVDINRITIVPVPDVGAHSLWTEQVDLLVPKYDLVISNDPFTLLLFRERGVKVIRAPLHRRKEMMATEIRRRMAAGDSSWARLVPVAVEKIIREIGGPERIKAIAERDVSHQRSE